MADSTTWTMQDAEQYIGGGSGGPLGKIIIDRHSLECVLETFYELNDNFEISKDLQSEFGMGMHAAELALRPILEKAILEVQHQKPK